MRQLVSALREERDKWKTAAGTFVRAIQALNVENARLRSTAASNVRIRPTRG